MATAVKKHGAFHHHHHSVILEKIGRFVKKNAVLCIAVCLAVATAFIVPPDKAYLSYFDFKTLTCLFCTLAVVCALNWGLFGFFGFNLVSFVFAGARSMGAILVYTLIALAAIWLIVSPLITRGRLVMGDE